MIVASWELDRRVAALSIFEIMLFRLVELFIGESRGGWPNSHSRPRRHWGS